MSKTVAFYTLGCKVNQSDTGAMQQLFKQRGYEIVDFKKSADVYIINTCIVTNVAEAKSRQMINKAIKHSPNAVVAVCGCYPQTFSDKVKSIKGVHLIVGNDNRAKIVDLVEKVKLSGFVDAVSIINNKTGFEDLLASNIENRTRAYLKVQEGCNQFCSYCIIPYARGTMRSRPLDSIKTQVQDIVQKGFQEIVLIGIHLGAYGIDLKTVKLFDAVKTTLNVAGLQRLRLGSIECVELSDELIDLLAQDKRMCKHLHLPLQSGCDAILEKMNRPYTTRDYALLIDKIRKKVPDIAISTDIIVGFPGETKDMFKDTCNFVQKMNFSKVHIFPFSARRGTPASNMQDKVPSSEKKMRSLLLDEIAKQKSNDYLKTQVGKEKEILFEQFDKTGKYIIGMTDNYIKAYVEENKELLGKIAKVKLEKIMGQDFFAQIIY